MSERTHVERGVTRADDIPPLTPAEAIDLERTELDRFVAVLEALPDESWSMPVGSSARTVHDVAAHVAGTYAAQGSLNQLRRQFDPRVIRMYRIPGESFAATLTRIQIGDRAGRSAAEIIEELNEVGPKALRLRSLLYRPLQPVRAEFISGLRLGPFAAIRDLWFHRLDVCEAAGIGFGLRDDHDGRFIALLLRAASPAAEEALLDRTVDVSVTELNGRSYRFGPGSSADATIEIDPINLAKLAAKRRSPAAARERSRIDGGVKIAMRLLGAIHGG